MYSLDANQERSKILAVRNEEGKIVGRSNFLFLEKYACYMAVGYLLPEYRNKGVYFGSFRYYCSEAVNRYKRKEVIGQMSLVDSKAIKTVFKGSHWKMSPVVAYRLDTQLEEVHEFFFRETGITVRDIEGEEHSLEGMVDVL